MYNRWDDSHFLIYPICRYQCEGDKLFPFLHYRNYYVPKTYFSLFYYSLYFLTPSFFPFGAFRTDRQRDRFQHPFHPYFFVFHWARGALPAGKNTVSERLILWESKIRLPDKVIVSIQAMTMIFTYPICRYGPTWLRTPSCCSKPVSLSPKMRLHHIG